MATKDELLASLKEQMGKSLETAQVEISKFYQTLMDGVSGLDVGASQAEVDALKAQVQAMKEADAKVVAAVASDLKPIS